MVDFYRRLFSNLSSEPERIFEIGIKNGGSLMLWRAMFPRAKIVGMDLGLDDSTRHEDITYLIGDQSDPERLSEIGREYGPFDLVIDDGSHIGAHQIISLKALAAYVSPGGTYVIEDIHAALKPNGSQYGPDVWSEFMATIFGCLRKHREIYTNPPLHVQTTLDLAPMIDDVILLRCTLTLRFADRGDIPERAAPTARGETNVAK